MSKRLRVLLPGWGYGERLTVGEWVRRVLRKACASRPAMGPEAKLEAVRRAVGQSFPTADVEQMLSEIERGYRS